MSARELLLLSPYRLPTQSTLYLADDEVSAFLNGYSALWHPAALRGAAAPPRLASPYDHEQPEAGHVYGLPANPPLMLPDDWEERARAAGAFFFQATADRAETLANLLAALPADEGQQAPPLAGLSAEQMAPFLGLGFGHLQLEALFEAMSHDNVLATGELWEEVSAAVSALERSEPEAVLEHLQAAANRLLEGREVVYAVSIHLIDLCLLGDQLDAPWPGSFERGQPCNLLACAALLERLSREHPERLAALRERVAAELAEVCGGGYLERADPLLPLESQLWNLLKGQVVSAELLGSEVRVFARRRFGFSPQTPLLLQAVGINHALLVTFDESALPAHRAAVVSWPSPDGKQVDAFTRAPHPADSPQTYFHLAYHLYQTIMQDQTATLALLHRPPPALAPGASKPTCPWYDDWLELTRLAPVLGRWTTLSGYFTEVPSGDYASAASADELHGDFLAERTGFVGENDQPERPTVKPVPEPISGFAQQVRGRRRLDTAWSLAALLRGLGGTVGAVEGRPFLEYLTGLEDRFESEEPVTAEELQQAQDRAAAALARRLVARGQENNPGYLVLNPCSFARRVVLELPEVTSLLPLGGPLKACQIDPDGAKLVVEVPALGFAWVPRNAPANAPAHPGRMRLADERMVRNEFFEAEVDPQTGGLRVIRDQRLRIGRVGQQLVFNPGSTMRVREVRTTSTGPAYGEIVSEGVLVDEAGQELATYRQRLRAWLGRPVLEMRIELVPQQPLEGYPWHNYYAARFAWRDERATLLRGVNGAASVTGANRPETPDFLELRLGPHNTVIFPGGLPFHQRHGGRMLDVLLVAQGETAQTFELGIGLEREHPMQTALGLVTPTAVVPTDSGPPHVGSTGWLFHLDAPNVLLSSLRPAVDGADAVVARLLECGGFGGPAELRCVRDPQRALVEDMRANVLYDATTQGDAVQLEMASNDLVQLRVEFG
jgi:alpha-mannosidase